MSPIVDDTIEIDINPSDVRTDTYPSRVQRRQPAASNKTDLELVRLQPTFRPALRLPVRRAARNVRAAKRRGRCCARLYGANCAVREAAAQALGDEKTDDIGWGHAGLAGYVLQPYQMVKDLRTDVETSRHPGGVLGGDLDQFMGAALAQKVGVTRDGGEAA